METKLEDWGVSKPGTPGTDIAGFPVPDYLTNKGALIDFVTCTLWRRTEKPAAPIK